MFDSVRPVVDWLFTELSTLVNYIWTSCGWVGLCVVGLPLLRWVVNIFKKII